MGGFIHLFEQLVVVERSVCVALPEASIQAVFSRYLSKSI